MAPRTLDVTEIRTFSRREREVLRMLAEGKTDREIGAALAISPRTVSCHAMRLYAKLGVHNRTQAAAMAFQQSLL